MEPGFPRASLKAHISGSTPEASLVDVSPDFTLLEGGGVEEFWVGVGVFQVFVEGRGGSLGGRGGYFFGRSFP